MESMMNQEQQLRDELQQLEAELDRAPELGDILERDDTPSLLEFQDAFGSWYSALWAAGITPTERPSYWTQDDIEHALRGLGELPDNPPVTKDLSRGEIYPSIPIIYKRFDSWNSALKSAGYETLPYRWTEDRLLDDLIELSESLGRKPRSADVANTSKMANPATYANVFGSWNEALAAAGFSTTPVGNPCTYTDEELITTLQLLASDLGRRPKLADLEDQAELPSQGIYYNRFGSWTNALTTAGIEAKPERDPQYSQAELLDALRTLAERVDSVPSPSDVDECDDLPASITYYRRFGSFSDALEQAGVSSGT